MAQPPQAAPVGQGRDGRLRPGGDEGPGLDWKGIIQQLFQTIAMMYFIQTITKTVFTPPSPTSQAPRRTGDMMAQGGGEPGSSLPSDANTVGTFRGPIWLIFREHDLLDMYLFMTEKEDFSYERDKRSLIWSEKRLSLAWEPGNERELDLNITVTPHMQQNGSVWGHVLFTKHGVEPNDANQRSQFNRSFAMTRYRKRRKVKNLKSLLDEPGGAAANATTAGANITTKDPPSPTTAASNGTVIQSYWKPSFDLNLVYHFVDYAALSYVPPQVINFMEIQSDGGYYPILHLNEFWLLDERLIALNETISEVPLHLSFSPIGFLKWMMQLQMAQHFKVQQEMGYSSEGEADMIRRMFLETNPVLLGVTMVVSVLHMVFDMLAFKADVAFWKNKKSLEGLSLRMIVVNTFFQVVIFLYLVDNETSWMVLFSSGLGLIIDFWKIKKAVQTSLLWEDPETKRPYRFPRIQFKAAESYTKTKTQEFDEIATSHLMYVVMPLVVGYAAYSLVHERHKGWYSWIISSLTSFIYIFGFVMMTPQLFINYKLRSVAHLPWRAMMYKFLNTFIDDLFAFIIKMPTMHRLSCFRDDIIFFIYLYQRWAYPVDKTRVNEFGQITEDNKASDDARRILACALTPEDKERLGLTGAAVDVDEVLGRLENDQDREKLCAVLRATVEPSTAVRLVSDLAKMPEEEMEAAITQLAGRRALTQEAAGGNGATATAHDVD